jgi:hypothetical protein
MYTHTYPEAFLAADPVPAATRMGFFTGVAAATTDSSFPLCVAVAAAAPAA